jgi:hypothetical protein
MRRAALCLAIFPNFFVVSAMGSAFAQKTMDISGNWRCVAVCPCEPKTGDPLIAQQGRRLKFVNECGSTARAKFVNRRSIAAPWGLTVTISKDGNRLKFRNGTIWQRLR